MNLTPPERSAILAQEFPDIIRPFIQGEDCPFHPAEQITLKALRSAKGPVPQVSITIIGRHRGKKGEWIAEYSVRDDRPLYMRPGSGYTRSAAESIDPEASVEDEATLQSFAISARLSHIQRQSSEGERRKLERGLQRRLRETMRSLNPQAQIALLGKLEGTINQAGLEEVA